jgi:aminoglycoside phosphotransferase (APT) family kinase protein
MARNNAAEKYLASRLQNYLAEHYPGATLSGFQFITSGYESEVYAFNLQGASETPKDLILRLLPGEGALQKLTREAHGLRLLHQAGYPVPELFLHDSRKTLGAVVMANPGPIYPRTSRAPAEAFR